MGAYRDFKDANPGVANNELRQMFRDQINVGGGNGVGINSVPQPVINNIQSGPAIQALQNLNADSISKTEMRAAKQALRLELKDATRNINNTYQNTGERLVNAGVGISLDLNSTIENITLGNNLFRTVGSVTINVGGETKTLAAGDKVTAAQYVAAKQVLVNGGQQVTVDGSGKAIGGNVDLSAMSDKSLKVGDLNIGQNVTAYGDFGKGGDVKISGDFTNSGEVVAFSSKNNVPNAAIRADNITNNAGAIITTQLTAGAKDLGGVDEKLGLTLEAANNLSNFGTINSAGDLTLLAGNTLTNSGTITAQKDVNVLSPNVVNSGKVESISSNINIDAPNSSALTVTNTNGTVAALKGDINIRNSEFTAAVDTKVTGGDLLSKELNVNAGTGVADVKVNQISGLLNQKGLGSHVQVEGGDLNLGQICLTGDPTYYNTAGNININGDIVVGETLTIIASQNITSANNINIRANSATQGFDINLIAGANITNAVGGSSQTSVGPINAPAGPYPNAGAVTIGGTGVAVNSASGGDVTLGTGVTITTNSLAPSSTSNGGNVNVIALLGSVNTSRGNVNLSGTTISTAGGSSANNGDVQIQSGGAGTKFIGNINTLGGSGSTGDVFVAATQATKTVDAAIVYNTNGTLAGGNSFGIGTVGTGLINFGGVITAGGGTVSGTSNTGVTFAGATTGGEVLGYGLGAGAVITANAPVTATNGRVIFSSEGAITGTGALNSTNFVGLYGSTISLTGLIGGPGLDANASSGNIGTSDATRLRTNVDILQLQANAGTPGNGNVWVTENDAVNLFGFANANKQFHLNILGAGDLNLYGTTIFGNNVALATSNGGRILQTADIVSTGGVNLIADGGIVGTGFLITGTAVVLTATNRNIGTVIDRIKTNATSLTLTANNADIGGGGIFITEANAVQLNATSTNRNLLVTAGGALTVAGVTNAAEQLQLTTTSGDINLNNTVGTIATNNTTLSANGSILGVSQVAGATLQMTATNGSVGTNANRVRTSANLINGITATNGSIYVIENDGVNLGPITTSATGALYFSTTNAGTINLLAFANLSGNDIRVTSAAGSDIILNAGSNILGSGASSQAILTAGGSLTGTGGISADTVNLTSIAGNIGSSAANRISTNAGTLLVTANATAVGVGNAWINENNSVNLTGAANKQLYVDAAGGLITVNGVTSAADTRLTAGAITVDANVTGTTNLSLIAAGFINGSAKAIGPIVNLTANTGNIGNSPASRFNTTAGTLNINGTSTTNVWINEDDAVNLNANSTGGQFYLNTLAAGPININGALIGSDIQISTFTGGSVMAVSANVGNALTTNVSLLSDGTMTGLGIVTGGTVSLTSLSSSIGVSAANRLRTSAGTLNLTANNGSAFINETDVVNLASASISAGGTLALATLGTGTMNINTNVGAGTILLNTVNAGSDIVVGNGFTVGTLTSAVNITAGGSITTGTVGTGGVIAGNGVTLTATNGNIGTGIGNNALALNAATLNATANAATLGNGNVWVNEANALNLGASTANKFVQIQSNGVLTVTGNVTAGDISLNSNFNDIAVNSALTATSPTGVVILTGGSISGTGLMTGDQVTLFASTGNIGTATGTRARTSANSLSATAIAGNIFISETDAVSLTSVSASNSAQVLINTLNAGNMTIANAITGGDIQLATTGATSNIILNAAVGTGATTNTALTAGGSITGNSVVSGTNVSLTATGGNVGTSGAARVNTNAVNLSASAPAAATGIGNVWISEVNGVNLNGMSANKILDVTAAGAINVIGAQTGNIINLTATGAGNSITVNGTLTSSGVGGQSNLTAANSINGVGLITGPTVSLIATAGNIGTNATTRVETNAGTLNLTASAAGGNAWVNEADTVNLGTSSVNNVLQLATRAAGNLTVTGTVTGNTVILETVAGGNSDIIVNQAITAGTQIALNSDRSIFGQGLLTATNLNLYAFNGNIGTTGIRILSNTNNLAISSPNGSAYVNNSATNFNLNSSTAQNLEVTRTNASAGNISIMGPIGANNLLIRNTAGNGGIVINSFINGVSGVGTNAATVSLIASGSGSIATNGASVSADSLNLTSGSGNIGAGTAINTNATTLAANTTGLVNITDTSTSFIDLNSSNGSIFALAGGTGGININGPVTGSTSVILSTTGNGNIIRTGLGSILASPGLVSLIAGGNVGTAVDRILTSAGSIIANAGVGRNVYITESDAVTINNSGVAGLTLFDVTAGGAMTINNITANNVVLNTSNGGDIIRSTGTITATNANLSSDFGNIGQTGNAIMTTATSNAVNTQGNVVATTTAVNANLQASSGNDFSFTRDNAAAGTLTLVGPLAANTVTLATATGNGSIALNSTIGGLFGGNATTVAVTANGSGNITTSGAQVSTAGLTLTSGSGNIGAGTAINTNAATLAANTTGTVAVSDSNTGTVTLNGSTASNFALTTANNLTLAGVLTAPTVALTTLGNGNITLSNNIVANTLANLTAGGSGNIVRTAGTVNGTGLTLNLLSTSGNIGQGNAIQTNAQNISANSSGNVTIAGTAAGNVNLLSSTGNQFNFTAANDLNVTGPLTSTSANLSSTNDDIVVQSAINTTGAIALSVAGANTISNTAAGTLTAGTSVGLTGATGAITVGGVINAGTAVNIANTNGGQTLNAAINADTVALSGGAGNIQLNSLITASTSVTINVTSGQVSGNGLGSLISTNTLAMTATTGGLGNGGSIFTSAANVSAATNATNNASDVDLTLTRAGAINLTNVVGDDVAILVTGNGATLNIGTATSNDDLFFITNAGTNVNYVLNNNITAGQVLLSTNGVGSITRNAGTITATTLDMLSGSGTIGTSGSNIFTNVTTLTANTTGNVYINEASGVAVDASQGNTFQLIANGTVNLNGLLQGTNVVVQGNAININGDVQGLGAAGTRSNSITLTASAAGNITRGAAGDQLITNALVMTSGTGNIGTGGIIETNATNITATTSGAGDIAITNFSTTPVTLSSVTGDVVAITLTANGTALNIGGAVNGATSVALTTAANGNINRTNSLGVITAPAVTLTSGANVGTLANRILTSADNLTVVANTAGANAFISETDAVTLGGTSAANATFDLVAGGNLTLNNLSGATVRLATTNGGNIIRNAGSVSATSLTLTSDSGNIGAAPVGTNGIFTNAGTIAASTTGDIYINDTNAGTVNVGVLSGSVVAVNTALNMALQQNVTGTSLVSLTAGGAGNITQVAGRTITTPTLALASTTGNIGAGNAITTNAANLSATTGAPGTVNVVDTNAGPVFVNALSGATSAVTTTGAGSSLIANGPITGGNVNLLAGLGTNGGIIVNSNINVTGIANLTADGSGNITNPNGVIGAGTLNLTSSSGNIGTFAKYIQTTAPNLTANTSGNVYVNDTGVVGIALGASTGSNFNVTFSSDLTVNGGIFGNVVNLTGNAGTNAGVILLSGMTGTTSVAINANGSGTITEVGGASTLINTPTIVLTSGSGNIGSPTNPIFINATNTTTNTTGSVYLSNSNAGPINIGPSTGYDYFLNFNGTINVVGVLQYTNNVSLLTTNNGSINVNAGIIAGNQILLNAGGIGNVTQATGVLLDSPILIVQSSGGNLGTSSNAIITNATTLTAFTTGLGDAFIRDTNAGNVLLAGVNGAGVNFNLLVNNAAGTSVSTALAGIVVGPNANITSVNGSVGAGVLAPLNVNVTNLGVHAAQNVYVTSNTNLNLTASNAGNNFVVASNQNLSSSGAITGANVVLGAVANGGVLTLAAPVTATSTIGLLADGNILDGSFSVLNAPTIALVSLNGNIGAVGNALDLNSTKTPTLVNLALDANTGIVNVASALTSPLNLVDVNFPTIGLPGATNQANGNFTVTNVGDIIVGSTGIDGGANVTLTSGANVAVNAQITGTNLNINSVTGTALGANLIATTAVNLNTTAGAITQSTGSVSTPTLNATASGGIGTLANKLNTNASFLTVNSTAGGDVYLNDTNVGNVQLVGSNGTSGLFSLTAANAVGTRIYTATNSDFVTGGTANITSVNGSVGNYFLGQSFNVSNLTNLVVNAAQNVNAKGLTNLNFGGGTSSAGNVFVGQANGVITSTSAISGTDVIITSIGGSGGSIALGAGLTATGTIALTSDLGLTTSSFTTVNAPNLILGSFNGNVNVTLNGTNAANTTKLAATASGDVLVTNNLTTLNLGNLGLPTTGPVLTVMNGAGGNYTVTGTGNLTTSNDIYVGGAVPAVKNIKLESTAGSVTLGAGTSILFALGGMEINSSTGINDANLNNGNTVLFTPGALKFGSAGNIDINLSGAPGGNIGGIAVGSIAANTVGNVTVDVTGTGINIGTSTGNAVIFTSTGNLSNSGTITGTSVDLTSSAGSATIGAQVSSTSTVSVLGTTGVILNAGIDADTSIALSSTGAGTITNPGNVLLDAPTLSLVTGSGDIGSTTNYIKTNATGITASTTGAIYINDIATADLNLGPITGGSLTLTSAGTINVVGLLTFTGDASLTTSNNGSINVNFAVSADDLALYAVGTGSVALNANLTGATSVTLTAQDGDISQTIGSVLTPKLVATTTTGDIGTLAAKLTTNATQLTVNSTSGDISVNDTNVGNVQLVGSNGTSGLFTFTAANAVGTRIFTATDSDFVTGGTANITSTNGSVGDYLLGQSFNVSNLTNLIVNAAVNVNARGLTTLNFGGGTSSAGNVFVGQANGVISSTSAISGTDVIITSVSGQGGSIALGAGLTATGTIALTSDLGLTTSSFTTVNAPNLILGSFNGNVNVTLDSTNAASTTTLAATALGDVLVTNNLTTLNLGNLGLPTTGPVLTVMNGAGGNYTVTGTGNLTTSNDIYVGGAVPAVKNIKLESTAGSVTLGAGTSILFALGGIEINSSTGINDANLNNGNTFLFTPGALKFGSAGNIDINLSGAPGGNIGGIAVGSIAANTIGNVTIDVTGTSVTYGASTGNAVILTGSGNVTTNGAITAASTLDIESTGGALSIDSALSATGAATLSALNDITNTANGSVSAASLNATSTNGTIGTALNNLKTTVTDLSLNAGTNAYVTNSGSVNLLSVTANNIASISTDALIGGDINISGPITAFTANLNSAFGGDITGSGIISASNVNLAADGSVGTSLQAIQIENGLANINLVVDAGGDAFVDSIGAGSTTLGASFANNFTLTTSDNAGSVIVNGNSVVAGTLNINTNSLSLPNQNTLEAQIINVTSLAGFAGGLTVSGGTIAGASLGTLVNPATEINLLASAGPVNLYGILDLYGPTTIKVADNSQNVIVNNNSVITGHDEVEITANALQLVGNGVITGDPLLVNAGSIVNQNGNVTLIGDVIFSGRDIAILASGNVNAGAATTINLSSNAANGGNLTVIAGYDFDASPIITPGQQTTGSVLSNFVASTAGGNINLGGVTINTTYTGTGAFNSGSVTLVASTGLTNAGTITTGTINTSTASTTTGDAGNVTAIGGGGVTVGAITATLAGGTGSNGTVDLAVAQAVVPGALTIQNGTVTGGPITVGTATAGDLAFANITGAAVTLTGALTAVTDTIVGSGLITAPSLTVNTGAGDATGIGNTAVQTLNSVGGGNVTIANNQALALGTISGATQNLSASAFGAITNSTAFTINSLTLSGNATAGNAAINLVSGTTATTSANLTSTGGGDIVGSIATNDLILTSSGNIGTSAANRFNTTASTMTANATTGSVFINDTNAGGVTIDGASTADTVAGQFNLLATGTINSILGGTVGGYDVTLNGTGFGMAALVSATNSVSATSSGNMTSASFAGGLTAPGVSLTSTGGSVGTGTSDRVTVDATNLTASATNGNVYVADSNSVTLVGGSANGTFDAVAATNLTQTGTITAANANLTATAGALTLNNVNVNTGTINLVANDSILNANLGGTLTANQLNVTSTAGSIGANGNALNVNVAGLTANAALDAYILSAGNVSLGNSSAGSANVFSLATTNGNITTTGTITGGTIALDATTGAGNTIQVGGNITTAGTVTLNADGNITVTDGTTVLISAATLNATSDNGNIGTTATLAGRLTTNASTLSANAFGTAGSVYINDTNTGVVTVNSSSANATGGTFNLLVNGDINTNAGGTISGDTVVLTSTTGGFDLDDVVTGTTSVSLTAFDSIINSAVPGITTQSLALTSTNGSIGTSALSRFTTNVANLSANAATGSVFINNTAAAGVTIDAASGAGATFDLLATNSITNTAAGTITAPVVVLRSGTGGFALGGNINGSTSVSLTAVNDITNANFTASITTPLLTLTSTTGNIGTSAAARFQTAGGTLSANALLGDVFLISTGALNLVSSTAGDEFNVLSTGTVTGTVAGDDVTINATGGNIGTSAASRLNVTATTSLNANASGSVFIGGTGQLNLIGANNAGAAFDISTSGNLVGAAASTVSGATVSLATGGQFNAFTTAINATTSLALTSFGNLDETQFTGTISTPALALRSTGGNVGVSTANRYDVGALTNFSAVSDTGSVFLNSNGAAAGVTLGASSAAGDFDYLGANTTTVAGNITTANGDINIVTAVNRITVNTGVSLHANGTTAGNGDILLRVSDTAKNARTSSIITVNGTLETDAIASPDGLITVSVGVVSAPATGKAPKSGVVINTSLGGQIFWGRRASKFNGVSNFTAKGTNIVLNNSIGSRNIIFNSATVDADPPVGPAMNIAINTPKAAAAAPAAIATDAQGAMQTMFGFDTDIAMVTSDLSVLNLNAAPQVQLANNAALATGNVANLTQANATSGQARANTTLAQVADDDDSYVVGYAAATGETGAAICSDVEIGVAQGKGIERVQHGDRVVIKKGNVLFVPFKDTTVETPKGNVHIAAKSVALVSISEAGLAVYDLEDQHKGSVSVESNGHNVVLSPGRHVLVTAHHKAEFAQVNAIETVAHRNVSSTIKNGVKAHVTEFSIPTALDTIAPLKAMVKSNHPEAKKIADRMMKTTAIILQIGGGAGQYQHYFKPRMTAMGN